MTYWIVEHAAYGTLADWEWRLLPNGKGEVQYPKFQWSGYRNEGICFFSLKEARDALNNCRKSGRRGMLSAYIVEMNDQKEPKCIRN